MQIEYVNHPDIKGFPNMSWNGMNLDWNLGSEKENAVSFNNIIPAELLVPDIESPATQAFTAEGDGAHFTDEDLVKINELFQTDTAEPIYVQTEDDI